MPRNPYRREQVTAERYSIAEGFESGASKLLHALACNHSLNMCPSCDKIAAVSLALDNNTKGLHGHGPSPWPTLASAHLRTTQPPPRIEQ